MTLDYSRILTRLRSRHAKSFKRYFDKSRRPRLLLLHAAIHDASVLPTRSISQGVLEDIRSRATDLKDLFTSLEDILANPQALPAGKRRIINILKQAHELISQTNIKAALENSRLDATLKESLPEAVGKVGRYYSVSRDLVRMARSSKYRVFNRISIKSIQISVPPPITNVNQSLTPATAIMTQLETYTANPFPTVQRQYQHDFLEHEKNKKIHAEIQILFFYEFHAELQRPRIICSSKSACYLCDLFVKLHDRFFMPRTHGRLYGAWTLPDVLPNVPKMRQSDLNLLVARFNAKLEEKILSVLSNQRVLFNHPNESVLVPAALWSSSTLSKLLIPSNPAPTVHFEQAEAEFPNDNLVPALTSTSILGSTSHVSSAETIRDPYHTGVQNDALSTAIYNNLAKSLDFQASPPGNNAPKDESAEVSPAAAPVVSSLVAPTFPAPRIQSTSPIASSVRLEMGQSNHLDFFDPSRPFRVETNNIHLILSRDDAMNDTVSDQASTHKHSVRVRSLDSTEHAKIKRENSKVLHVDDMREGEDITVEHGGMGEREQFAEIYLCYKEVMIGIQYISST